MNNQVSTSRSTDSNYHVKRSPSPKVEPLRISNKFLVHLDRIFLERGGNMIKVMEEAGLPYETLLGPEMMISYKCHMRVLELSENELDIRPIGLVLSTRQMVAHLTPLFDILFQQKTVHDSIITVFENLQHVVEGLRANLRVDQDLAYVELFTEQAFLQENAIFHDHGAGLLAQYLRWIIGRRFKLVSVSIPHSEPHNLSRYRSFFGCPVSFGDSHIALCFAKAMLNKPLMQTRRNLVKEYNEVLEWDRNASLLARLRTAIRQDITGGSSQLGYVAEAMNVSKRTLQRRLAEKGTSFHRQLDSVRAGMARKYIYQTELSILEIAMRLGYAKHECFTRAFSRWYAKTPLEWRVLIDGIDNKSIEIN